MSTSSSSRAVLRMLRRRAVAIAAVAASSVHANANARVARSEASTTTRDEDVSVATDVEPLRRRLSITTTTTTTSNIGLLHQHQPPPHHAASATTRASDESLPVARDTIASAKGGSDDDDDDVAVEVDFVIVGLGSAGRAALGALREEAASREDDDDAPALSVLTVDPREVPDEDDDEGGSGLVARRSASRVVGVDHARRLVRLDDGSRARYRSALLIGTGSRGAPVPAAAVDPAARARVLEARPAAEGTFPSLNPEATRRVAALAASQGARVAVLGGGLAALETTAAAVAAGDVAPTLVFGDAAPLTRALPPYLCSALTSRLRRVGIDARPRTLVRYVSSAPDGTLELHLARSFDALDTSRTTADLLIVAPKVKGECGTAVLPIPVGDDDDYDDDGTATPRYKAWSELVSDGVVACFANDGRILVNAEFCAASGIYAAGSVARRPRNGEAAVAGEGDHDARAAGRTAARNMLREHYRAQNRRTGGLVFERPLAVVPTWRSDRLRGRRRDDDEEDVLGTRLGVRAVCVGDCDAAASATHGVWWTNRARLERRRTKGMAVPPRRRRRRRRRRASFRTTPVYGVGVVYYVDRDDRVRGCLLWGVPLPDDDDDDDDVARSVIDDLGAAIGAKGVVVAGRHYDDDDDDDDDPDVLHLVRESERVLRVVLSGRNGGDVGRIGRRPLHRYAPPSRSSSIRRDRERLFLEPSSSSDYDANDDRSRPSKEEPLWSRPKELHRRANVKELLFRDFLENMREGRFADGSSPYEPPPKPRFLERASDGVRSLLSSLDDDDEVDDDDDDDDEVDYGEP